MKKLKNDGELFDVIAALLNEKGRLTVAIDGRCAAGKTTLAKKLAVYFGGNLIHADDFFLQPFQRTAERLKETGGNLDRERLISQVLEMLKKGSDFTYRPFICSKMALGEAVTVKNKPFTVVEGSYSCHPETKKYYDLTVFLNVDGKSQIDRIRKRNTDEQLTVFKEKWIPLEERYFEAFNVAEACDYYLEHRQ